MINRSKRLTNKALRRQVIQSESGRDQRPCSNPQNEQQTPKVQLNFGSEGRVKNKRLKWRECNGEGGGGGGGGGRGGGRPESIRAGARWRVCKYGGRRGPK